MSIIKKQNISPLNNVFDRVVCINLVERQDRNKLINNELKKFNIKFEFYNPVKFGFAGIIAEEIMNSFTKTRRGFFNIFQPNEVGCAISHYSVIKKAYLEGVNNLFIFEDDITLDDDFNEKFKLYYSKIPKDWNMMLLYSFMQRWEDRMIPVNEYWRTAHNNWSCVAYGMNRKFMEEYIKSADEYFCIADLTTLKLEEKLKCYVLEHFLVNPNLNESDIREIKK